MADVEAGAAEVHDAARVGRRDDCALRIGAGPPERGDLAVADRSRRARVGARRTRRPRRSTGRRRRCRAGHRPRRARCGPRRAPSARGAGGTDPGRRPRGPVARVAGTPVRDDPLGEVLARAPRTLGLGGAEQVAVLLHARAAARAVDDDRCVAGHRRDHASGERACFVVATGVHVQRAATRPSRPRSRDPRAGRPHHPGRRAVRVAHPRVHHAAGEQPRVGFAAVGDVERAADCAAGGAGGRTASARGAGAGPTRAHHVSASSTAWYGSSDAVREPLGHARRGTGDTAAAAAPRCGSPPSGGRTARPTGTRPRSRGTARIRPSRGGTRRRSARPVARRRASPRCGRAATRSRGPVTRYVGQCGRQSPHATHATSSSSSRSRGVVDFGVTGVLTAGAVPVRACRSDRTRALIRRMSAAFGSGPPEAVDAVAARFAQHPPAVRVRGHARGAQRVGRVGRDVHRADAELRAPAHAGAREVGRERADRAGRDRDPTAVRSGRERRRGRRRSSSGPAPRRRPARLRGARARRAVPEHRGRAEHVARRLAGPEPLRGPPRGAGTAASPARARPSVPSEPTSRRGRS